MAKGFHLDTLFNDITYANGSLLTVENGEEIARNVKTRLSLSKGEYFLDKTYGFPYVNFFGRRVIDISLFETIVKQFILETPGVNKLTRFQIDFEEGNERKFVVSFSAETIYSEITVTGFKMI